MNKKEVTKMAFQIKSFVFGKGTIPSWINDEAVAGRLKANYEDGELISMTLFTPGGTVVVKEGDVILLTRSGLAVLPVAEAKKYLNDSKASRRDNDEDA